MNTIRRKILLGSAVMAAVMSVGRFSAAAAEDTKKFDSQESAFLRTAAQDDVFMEQLGQYAMLHADSDQVKELGKQVAKDHDEDRKAIEKLAEGHGVNLETHDQKLTPEQQTIYKRLTAKAGANFDKDYTKLLVSEHTKDVGLYKRERDHAADVAVREYAAKTTTTLEDHLKKAKEVEKVVWGL